MFLGDQRGGVGKRRTGKRCTGKAITPSSQGNLCPREGQGFPPSDTVGAKQYYSFRDRVAGARKESAEANAERVFKDWGVKVGSEKRACKISHSMRQRTKGGAF